MARQRVDRTPLVPLTVIIMLRKILQPFYTAYVIVTFLISLLLALPFFLLIGIANNITSRLILWNITHYWSIVWLWLIGMPVRKHGTLPTTGNFVIVANHISYLDTIVIYAAISRSFRPLGKKEMSKIPLFGLVYRQLVLMVDRSSAHSRAKSMRLMWKALKHECSVIIFPEGTFNETGAPLKSFYDGAFRLAVNTQTTILPVLFPDTVHRWHYSGWWKLWPGRNRAIFLPQVDVAGMDTNRLKQKVFALMETELKKYQ